MYITSRFFQTVFLEMCNFHCYVASHVPKDENRHDIMAHVATSILPLQLRLQGKNSRRPETDRPAMSVGATCPRDANKSSRSSSMAN